MLRYFVYFKVYKQIQTIIKKPTFITWENTHISTSINILTY